MKPIFISLQLWNETWSGLRKRGGARRESACIWAGDRTKDSERVSRVVYLDDLPDVTAGMKHHRASREATRALFQDLRKHGEQIVADVHTHPRAWVGLSTVDEEHPIEFRPGLPAIVIPNLARGSPRVEAIGLHEYLGHGRWQRLEEVQLYLKIGGSE